MAKRIKLLIAFIDLIVILASGHADGDVNGRTAVTENSNSPDMMMPYGGINPVFLLSRPQDLTPEKVCPSWSNGVCAWMQIACSDVPDIIDCGEQVSTCRAQGEKLCTCFSNCTTSCGAVHKCTDDPSNTIGQMACVYQRIQCINVCQSSCPVSSTMDMLGSYFKGAVYNVQGYLASELMDGQEEYFPADFAQSALADK